MRAASSIRRRMPALMALRRRCRFRTQTNRAGRRAGGRIHQRQQQNRHRKSRPHCAPRSHNSNYTTAPHPPVARITNRPARKRPRLVFASAALERSSAESSQIFRPFSRKCPQCHRTALCMQTSQSFHRARLQSTIHISLLASSSLPCTVVTRDHGSFQQRAAVVGALLVNRPAGRFILRSRSAGSKGLPVAARLRPSLPGRQPFAGSVRAGMRHRHSLITLFSRLTATPSHAKVSREEKGP
jgi:hypothetical protein